MYLVQDVQLCFKVDRTCPAARHQLHRVSRALNDVSRLSACCKRPLILAFALVEFRDMHAMPSIGLQSQKHQVRAVAVNHLQKRKQRLVRRNTRSAQAWIDIN